MDPTPKPTGRLAPSPTGRIHAGNIYSALLCWLLVRSLDGTLVLRIDDLDEERSKRVFADQVMTDFENLGLTWDEGPIFQQDNKERYQEALAILEKEGLVYPCFCTRADLHSSSAPHRGEKAIYPGTCRALSAEEIRRRTAERQPALRLRVPERRMVIDDMIQGAYDQELSSECGDFIIQRSDGLFAYQLACVVDDGEEGVDLVVRGMDLLSSAPQQEYLRELLGFEPARYAHGPLLVAEENRRLSKRDADASLESMLEAFGSFEAVIGHIAYLTGLSFEDAPMTPEDLLKDFDLQTLRENLPDRIQIPFS